MSNLRTILQNSQELLGPMSDAELKKQLKALRQIELVSMQAKIPIFDVDIIKIFRAKEGCNKLVTAPKEINKRLFDFQSANKAIIQRASLEDLVKHEKRILTNAKKYMAVSLDRPQHEIDNCDRNIVAYNQQLSMLHLKISEAQKVDQAAAAKGDELDDDNSENIRFWMRDTANIKRRIVQTEEAKVKLVEKITKLKNYTASDALIKDIAKISLNGFWKFIGLTGIKLHFATANDVILFEKNDRSGLNMQKNMGRYLCEFDLSRFHPKVFPLARNISYNGHIHPYVSQDRHVCFGNAADHFQNAAQATDLVQCMNILGTVLSAYSSAGGPYTTLNYFISGASPVNRYPAISTKYMKKNETPAVKRLDELLSSLETKKEDNTFAKVLGPTHRRPTPVRFTVSPVQVPINTIVNEAQLNAPPEPVWDTETEEDQDEESTYFSEDEMNDMDMDDIDDSDNEEDV